MVVEKSEGGVHPGRRCCGAYSESCVGVCVCVCVCVSAFVVERVFVSACHLAQGKLAPERRVLATRARCPRDPGADARELLREPPALRWGDGGATRMSDRSSLGAADHTAAHDGPTRPVVCTIHRMLC